MARIISVVNQRSGVGKTSTAVNLAAALAAAEVPTLLVDLDPDGGATGHFGIEDQERNLHQCFIGSLSPMACLHPTDLDSLWVLPSSRDLAGVEVQLLYSEHRKLRLKEVLRHFASRFQVILIDCPSSLGLLTINALVSSHGVIVPIQCEYYSLESLNRLMCTIEEIERRDNPDLSLEGIILTMFEYTDGLSSRMVKEIRRNFSDLTFGSIIPRSPMIPKAAQLQVPMLLLDATCRTARAFLALAEEVMENLRLQVEKDSWLRSAVQAR